jgi:hypothetical protein
MPRELAAEPLRHPPSPGRLGRLGRRFSPQTDSPRPPLSPRPNPVPNRRRRREIVYLRRASAARVTAGIRPPPPRTPLAPLDQPI